MCWWFYYLLPDAPTPHRPPFPPKELPLSQAAGQDHAGDWGGGSGDLKRGGTLPQTQQGCSCWKVKLREGKKRGTSSKARKEKKRKGRITRRHTEAITGSGDLGLRRALGDTQPHAHIVPLENGTEARLRNSFPGYAELQAKPGCKRASLQLQNAFP